MAECSEVNTGRYANWTFVHTTIYVLHSMYILHLAIRAMGVAGSEQIGESGGGILFRAPGG